MKNCEKIIYSVPGKLMLLGEHAILHGENCLSMAIDKRIKVELKQIDEKKVIIYSNIGTYNISILELDKKNIKNIPVDFRFVIAAVKNFNVKTGIELIINSDFPPTFGLGSSSAVTIGTVACLREFYGRPMNLNDEDVLKEIFDECSNVVFKVQNKKGSGYDIATSIWGGIIQYKKEPFFVKKIKADKDFPISVIYTGYKTKTTDVISVINEKSKNFEKEYSEIYKIIGKLVNRATELIKEKNWKELGKVFNINQGLLDAIGVSDKTCSDIIYWARENGAFGSKISGAGLGDCIIAVGDIPIYPINNDSKIRSLVLNVTEFGLKHE